MLSADLHTEVRADEECCAELQTIGFASNLPVVIVDTGGTVPDRTKIIADICTCDSPKHGDYAGNVTFHVRGGIDSRKPIYCLGTDI